MYQDITYKVTTSSDTSIIMCIIQTYTATPLIGIFGHLGHFWYTYLCSRWGLRTCNRSFQLHLTRFERIWKNQKVIVSYERPAPKSMTFWPSWPLGTTVTFVIRERKTRRNMHRIEDVKYYILTCSNCIEHVTCRITFNWQHVDMLT